MELLRAPFERAAAKGNRQHAQRADWVGAEAGDALHEAIEGEHGDIVSVLLESGASLATTDICGFVPLYVAALQEETEMVPLLALKGADKDVFDNMERSWQSTIAIQQPH